MTEERLRELLQSAMRPMDVDHPVPDLWRAVVDRVDRSPRWSAIDLGLAAAVAVTLLMNPEWLWLLAYHL